MTPPMPKTLSQDEMFEKTFERPKNYFELPEKQQWEVDKRLGILDWDGRMTPAQNARYRIHWGLPPLEWKTQVPTNKNPPPLPSEKEHINHPQHYGGDTTYEVIKVIHAWGLGFNLGNTVKYIARAGQKDPSKEIEDLEKAKWYLEDHIKQLKEQYE